MGVARDLGGEDGVAGLVDRAGTDQGHVATQNVEELGDDVQAGDA